MRQVSILIRSKSRVVLATFAVALCLVSGMGERAAQPALAEAPPHVEMAVALPGEPTLAALPARFPEPLPLTEPLLGDSRARPRPIAGLGSLAMLDVQAFTTDVDDPVIPCLGGQGHQSAWFSYTSGGYGLLVFDTARVGAAYDGAVAVWVEQPDDSLRLVTCGASVSGGARPQVDVAAQPGVTYLIEVVAKDPGARWLRLWVHACSALPLPPQALGLCAYPGPATRPEPPYITRLPLALCPN